MRPMERTEKTSFFKDFLNMPVLDRNGEKVGKVIDLAVRMGETFPRVSSVIVEVSCRTPPFGWAHFHTVIPWRNVKEFNGKEMILSIETQNIKIGILRKNELLLQKCVMDQQIVDNQGRKLVRVNDIRLKEVDGKLRLAGVETGMWGFFSRLGGKKLEGLARFFNVKIMENIIMWELVEKFDSEMKRIKLGISREMMRDMYNL